MKKLRNFYIALMVIILGCLIYFKELRDKGMLTVVVITLVFIILDKFIIESRIKKQGVKKIVLHKFNPQTVLIPLIGLGLLFLNNAIADIAMDQPSFLNLENGIVFSLFLLIAFLRKDIILLVSAKGIDYNYNSVYIKWEALHKSIMDQEECKLLTKDPDIKIAFKKSHVHQEDFDFLQSAIAEHQLKDKVERQ